MSLCECDRWLINFKDSSLTKSKIILQNLGGVNEFVSFLSYILRHRPQVGSMNEFNIFKVLNQGIFNMNSTLSNGWIPDLKISFEIKAALVFYLQSENTVGEHVFFEGSISCFIF